MHGLWGMGQMIRDCGTKYLIVVDDDVHLLTRFGRTITQANWIKELQRVSNLQLKERGRDYADFEWQGGRASSHFAGRENRA